VDHFSLPPGCVRLATSEATANQAFVCPKRPVVGLQFHPELTLDLVDYFAREHSEEWVPSTYVLGKDAVRARIRAMEDTYWLMERILDNTAGWFRMA
jgi:GMP synthase-like glutamine amidotransferase